MKRETASFMASDLKMNPAYYIYKCRNFRISTTNWAETHNYLNRHLSIRIIGNPFSH